MSDFEPYPCRLYMAGEVIPGDLHATNSVVVADEAGELAARANGYRRAYESAANGGSESAPGASPLPDQGAVAGASADPDDLESLRAQAAALGVKVHHKAGVAKVRAAIAEAQA